MANRKFSQFTAGPTRSPLDTLVGLDVSAASNAQNSYWTLNTLFSVITNNITDGAVRFGGVSAPAVSAAGAGAIYFDSGSNSFQVSQNAGSYTGLIFGSAVSTRVSYGSGTNTLTSSAAFTFASNTLTLGVASTTSGSLELYNSGGANSTKISAGAAAAALNYILPATSPTVGQVLSASAPSGANVTLSWTSNGTISGSIANTQVAVGSGANTISGSSALTFASGVVSISGTSSPGAVATSTAAGTAGFTADQTVSGAASYAFYYMQSPSSAALLQLTTAGFTPANLIKANQLRLYGATGTVETLFELADASTAFAFGINNARVASINATASESLVLGVASSLTGRVKMFNSAGATYTQLSAGNAAASLNYILPATSPSAGYVLTASAPSGSNVTLSWSASAASSLTATQVGFGDGSNMLSGSADFLYATASGQLSITKTVNTNSSFVITNDDVGNGAQAAFAAQATTARLSAYATGSGWTPAGGIGASYSVLESNTLLALKAASGQAISFLIDATTHASLTSTQLAVTTVPTTGAGLSVAASTVTSGSLVSLSMTGTAAASNTKTALAIASSGANGTATQTVTGASVSVTNTGTTNTNVALTLTASGAATANTALLVTAGQVVLPLGTVGLPSFTPTGDNTSGLYWTTATNLSLAVSGTERYRFGSGGTFSSTGGFAVGTSAGNVDVGLTRQATGVWRISNSSTGAGSLVLGTSTVGSIGTSGVCVLAIANGTPPSSSPADEFQLYSKDSAAANAEAFIRNENGNIARLTGTIATVSAQFDVVSSTTLATVTGSTVQVEAGVTYNFRANVFLDAGAVGGIKLSIGGTATATAVIFQTFAVQNTTTAFAYCTRQTALDGATTAVGGTGYWAQCWGTITVNAAGTLGLRFAQAVSDGTNSSVLAGSMFQIWQS